MVKLDYDRDYYADLELPPLADVAEVKKQFKKLGELGPRVDRVLSRTDNSHQRSNGTLIATPARKMRPRRSSWSSRPPTRFSRIQLPKPNSMPTARERPDTRQLLA
jgi:hypothetical protein